MHESLIDSYTPSSPGKTLLERRDQIIDQWIKRVGAEINQASRIPLEDLTADISALIDCMAQALTAGSYEAVEEQCHRFGQFHGSERARISDYNPDEILQEYHILCEIMCDLLEKTTHLTAKDFRVITGVMSGAMRDSMIAYSEVQASFRERFIATLAHDLRNPLGVAKTAAELIVLDCNDPEEVCFLANRSLANLKRADDLLQSLLDVAYMHSGYDLNYKMDYCDLKGIVVELVQGLSITHGNRFIVIGEYIDGYWNKSAIRRAIENLLTNAIKYGAHDKPVTIEFKRDRNFAEIRVHNEGRPIPQVDQKRIFQPFKREKSVLEAKPGWGLGLCFVQTAVEAHKGEVHVDSNTSTGTDFIIRLPIDSRH
jgi:signal transduction histidine kinase